jgi:hypothetical protein
MRIERRQVWIGYGVLAAVVLILGVWKRAGMDEARVACRNAESQLAAVRGMIGSRPREGAGSVAVASEGIGAAVQQASLGAGLGRECVTEVSSGPSAGGSGRSRVALEGVRTECLVRFVFALQEKAGLRTAELTLDRRTGRDIAWDATLALEGGA